MFINRCRDIARRFLSQKNGDSQHTVHAMGHAHMDTGKLIRHILGKTLLRSLGTLALALAAAVSTNVQVCV